MLIFQIYFPCNLCTDNVASHEHDRITIGSKVFFNEQSKLQVVVEKRCQLKWPAVNEISGTFPNFSPEKQRHTIITT